VLLRVPIYLLFIHTTGMAHFRIMAALQYKLKTLLLVSFIFLYHEHCGDPGSILDYFIQTGRFFSKHFRFPQSISFH